MQHFNNLRIHLVSFGNLLHVFFVFFQQLDVRK